VEFFPLKTKFSDRYQTTGNYSDAKSEQNLDICIPSGNPTLGIAKIVRFMHNLKNDQLGRHQQTGTTE